MRWIAVNENMAEVKGCVFEEACLVTWKISGCWCWNYFVNKCCFKELKKLNLPQHESYVKYLYKVCRHRHTHTHTHTYIHWMKTRVIHVCCDIFITHMSYPVKCVVVMMITMSDYRDIIQSKFPGLDFIVSM